MESGDSNITELLVAWGAGDARALESLMPLVYDHLHELARAGSPDRDKCSSEK
jgi:hypothetical protein